MAKKEGYRNYELEPGVIEQIGKQKKNNGIAKDFTVNKAIEFFFAQRSITKGEKYVYEFNTEGRGNVYFYLKRESYDLLDAESTETKEPFNRIINEAVKFYLKNKV